MPDYSGGLMKELGENILAEPLLARLRAPQVQARTVGFLEQPGFLLSHFSSIRRKKP